MEVAVLVAHFWYVIKIVVANCANATASDVISVRPDFLSMRSDLGEKEKFIPLLYFSEFLLDNIVFSGPSFLCASLLSAISHFFIIIEETISELNYCYGTLSTLDFTEQSHRFE